jgi:hypothetical protein
MERVDTGCGNSRNAVEPIAIFIFYPCEGVLRRLGVGGHKVPRTDWGATVVGGVVVIEVGGTERVEHFVAEGTGAKIFATSSFECEVESVNAFTVDIDFVAVEVPFVWPKEVAPSGVGTFYDEINVVDIAIVVAVEVVGRGNRGGVVDPVDGADEKVELALGAVVVVCVAYGVVFGVGHVVGSWMIGLEGEDGIALRGGCVVGSDE